MTTYLPIGTMLSDTRLPLTLNLIQAFGEAGLEFPGILAKIARLIGDATADAVILHLRPSDGIATMPLAVYHPDPSLDRVLQELHLNGRTPAENLLSQAYLELDEPVHIPNLQATGGPAAMPAGHQSWLPKLPAYSLLAVPLRVQERPLGILVVLRTSPNKPFSLEDQNFYQNLAAGAARAIDHAKLNLAAEQRAHELEALRAVTTVLLSNLNLDSLLGQIIDAAIRAIPSAQRGMLYLLARDTGELQIRAVQGFSDPRIRKLALQQITGYPARAVQKRQSLLVADVQADLVALNGASSKLEEVPVRSLVAAPLVLPEQTLGVLVLNSAQVAAFTQADLRLLESFAATATTALQNAYLHTEVQKLAITDALTRLYNRRGFFELAQHELDRARRFERPLSILMLDLDHLKQINDTYGHSMGDVVLQTLSHLMQSSLREVDVIGRYGGDEFLILLPETDLFFATQVAERIRNLVATHPWPIPAGPVSVSVSVGVTKLTSQIKDINGLIARADAALYKAKGLGRNRVEVD